MAANQIDWGAVAEADAPRVWAAAREVAPDEDAAWDCVQEAFLTGLKSTAGPEGDPASWLCGVAKNHARHMARSRRRWFGLLDRFAARSRARARRTDNAGLTAALSRLPARERDAVLLRYLAGMTVAEVAAAQRISEAAAKSRVRRGLSRLRRILGPAVLVFLLVRAALASPNPLGPLSEALAAGGAGGLPVTIGAMALAALGGIVPFTLRSPSPEPPPVLVADAVPSTDFLADGAVFAAASGPQAKQWIYFDSRETESGPYLLARTPDGSEQKIPVAEDTGVISYLANGAFSRLPTLSISLGDTNRVYVRPSLEGLAEVESAVLVFRLHQSGIPVTEPFDVAVHRVTAPWTGTGVTWHRQPASEEEPAITRTLDPDAEEFRVDLTALVKGWLGDASTNHGILLEVARPVGPPPAPIPAQAKKERPKAAKDPRAGRWVYFDSKEAGNGPRLHSVVAGGKTDERKVAADALVIGYLPDGKYGAHQNLSINLGDTYRVLLRFRLRGLTDVERAEIVLSLHPSSMPPREPFDLAVHAVKEVWGEHGTSWNGQPPFEETPLLVTPIDPAEGEVRLDVTAVVKEWLAGDRENHGLLLKVAKPLGTPPVPTGRGRATTWTQPAIRTGTPFSDKLPWAPTVEEAIDRAAAEKKLVLATVVPIASRRWASGYEAAREEWLGSEPHPWGDERVMAIDSGLVKERAMMASLFTDPEIAGLVRAHFVPVRIRLHTYYFDPTAARGLEDPVASLGTTALEAGGPSLVFARPDGTLVHACRRMGVFSVPMVRSMLVAVLEKAGVKKIAVVRADRDRKAAKAWELARAGKLEAARGRLVRLRKPSAEAAYLLGHLEDALGDEPRARELWTAAVRDDPEGPWGSKAAVRLKEREGRIEEWETLVDFRFDPLAERTEVDRRESSIDEVLGDAVDYLLLTQRADGGWRDPFMDTSPRSGPDSQYDKTVPRTGLVVDALLAIRERLPNRRKRIEDAIRRGIDFVGRFADDPPAHTWRLTYALHLQVAILKSNLPEEEKQLARRRSETLLKSLRTVQHQGGWSYVRPPRIHSFNTAPVLLMMAELRELGVVVPKVMADGAASFLEGLREKEDPREFAYASSLHHKSLRASSCRTALCELALLEHSGGKDVSGLRAGVDLFFTHEAKVRDTTKVFEAYFSPTAMHDAYHYYFGHYYVARALARLPKDEAKRYAEKQMDILLGQVELDGSFVDAQMQGKSYSTAMAVLTLVEDLRYK